MFKKSLIALLVAGLVMSGSAVASEDNADVAVTLQSKLVDNGVALSDDVSAGVSARFNDVVLDGLFVNGKFDTLSLTPLNSDIAVRTEFGVGYQTEWFSDTKWEVSLNRVLNPVRYSDDYTEATLKVSKGIFYGEVTQGVTSRVNRDTYAAVGAEIELGRATVGGLVSGVYYDKAEFNNAEVYAKYNVWRDLDLNVNYSYGGDGRNDVELDNVFWGGATYRF